jgi:hypothetical protein
MTKLATLALLAATVAGLAAPAHAASTSTATMVVSAYVMPVCGIHATVGHNVAVACSHEAIAYTVTRATADGVTTITF